MKILNKWKLVSVWAIAVFLVVGGLTGVVLIVVAAVGADNAAAWVQAIGSILAVAAGFAVVAYQDQVRERKHHKEAWIYMEKTLHAASYAVASVDFVRVTLMEKNQVDSAEFRMHVRLLEGCTQDMAAISYVHIEDQKVAAAWLAIKRCMNLACAAMLDAVDKESRFNFTGFEKWSIEISDNWIKMSEAIQEFVIRHEVETDA